MSTTNLSQLKNLLNLNYPISDDYLTAQLRSYSLDPDGEYIPNNAFDYVLFQSAIVLLSGAVRISESGYTVELNTEGLKYLIRMLANKWGWIDPTSDLGVIKNATNKW